MERANSFDLVLNKNQELHFNSRPQEVLAKKISSERRPKNKYECPEPECFKSYNELCNLKLHIQSFHERKTRFNCNFCDYKTFFKITFLRHLTAHLDVADGKLKRGKLHELKVSSAVCLTCQMCSENFESFNSFKNHFEEKHKCRKFECDWCGYQTVRKMNLVSHINSYHLLKHSALGMYDKERPFKCTSKDCYKRFMTENVLRQHMTTHSGRMFSYLLQN